MSTWARLCAIRAVIAISKRNAHHQRRRQQRRRKAQRRHLRRRLPASRVHKAATAAGEGTEPAPVAEPAPLVAGAALSLCALACGDLRGGAGASERKVGGGRRDARARRRAGDRAVSGGRASRRGDEGVGARAPQLRRPPRAAPRRMAGGRRDRPRCAGRAGEARAPGPVRAEGGSRAGREHCWVKGRIKFVSLHPLEEGLSTPAIRRPGLAALRE